MMKIVFPLRLQMKCSQVADLHQALLTMNLRISDIDIENEKFGNSTRDAICKFQENNSLPVTGEVDEDTVILLNDLLTESCNPNEEVTYVVKGIVINVDDRPVDNLIIKAFDINHGNDVTLLGQSAIDAQGKYSITYSPVNLNGKSAADLMLVLYQGDTPLQSSDIIFDAPQETTKDFNLPKAIAPEFQRLTDKIKPLLRNKIGLGKLEKQQIDFLNKKIP